MRKKGDKEGREGVGSEVRKWEREWDGGERRRNKEGKRQRRKEKWRGESIREGHSEEG